MCNKPGDLRDTKQMQEDDDINYFGISLPLIVVFI